MIDLNVLSLVDKVTFVFQFLTIAVAFIGIAGNLATFVVLSRRAFKKFSFPYYLRVKMLADIYILLHSFRHFSAFFFDASIDLTTEIVCKLAEYTVYVVSEVSIWHLTLIGADRFLSIVFPQRFKIIKKRQFQMILTLLVSLYGVFLYLPMPIYYTLSIQNAGDTQLLPDFNSITTLSNWSNSSSFVSTCSVQEEDKANIINLISLVDTIMLVFFVNNLLTALTLVFLFRSRRKFSASNSRTTQANSAPSSTAIKDRKFAINSVVLDLVSFVCKTPLLTLLVCSAYLDIGPEEMNMLFTIGVCIYTIENAQSFFTNFLVNSIFHDEFLAMVSMGRIGSSAMSVSTSNTLTTRAK
jgi:hypothetical protein